MKPTKSIFARATKFFVVASLWLAVSVPAASFLQEGFNYPASVLGNNSPWNGATSLIVVSNVGQTFPNLADFSPPSLCAAVAPGTTAVSYRPLNISAGSGVVYFSLLINFVSKPGSYYIAGLLQSTNAPPGGAAADPLDLIDNTSGTGYKLGVRAKGGTTSYVANSLVPMSTNTTYFVVMKYNFASGQASLYLNPPPGGTEPATPDATSTAATPVTDLSYLYLRSGSSTAGNFLVSTLRVASTWSEATPSASAQKGQLNFVAQPSAMTAGTLLPTITVQLEDALGNNLASNNVPVTLSLNGDTFAGGAATANTSATGHVSFNNLIINTAGTFTLTAAANGFNSVSSSNFVVSPAAIDHYALSVLPPEFVNQSFAVAGTALDIFSNVVTTDIATRVTLSSTGNVIFDANNNGIFGETRDNIIVLNNGLFSIAALDNFVQTAAINAVDASGKTGMSASFSVISNNITANGAMLNAFLDSLQVNKFWLVGTSVNWLTGVPGGNGPNMTLGTDSHCSAFAPAAAELLGVYLLRPPDASDLNLANNQADWFATNTAGWFPITTGMTNVQHMVNTGLLVMASYKASSGSGHIAVLRASNRSDADVNAYGPEECQSGTYNFADTNIVTGFNQHSGAFPNNIKYYGHNLNYPVSPTWPWFGTNVVANQNFKASMTTIIGRAYQLQSSSNLVNWTTLLNFTNSNVPATFFTNATLSDALAGNRQKFYRVRPQ